MIGIVTGATGQDGSYLVELLLEKGYEVRCAVRRTTYPMKYSNIAHLTDRVKIYDCDLTDQSSLFRLFGGDDGPFEVYNLAAQSQVGTSFNCPQSTFEINTIGTLNLLECIRQLGIQDRCKFYQASTSEMFGKVQEVPQTESTQFYPRSPYGVSKLAAHWMVKNYRETYGIFACSGILFNHESPRRGDYFVTQKIVKGIKDVVDGKIEVLEIGNPDATRDWGHAKDYVKAMWLMLQQERPDDYVVATGIEHSIQDLANIVAKKNGIELSWDDQGAINSVTGARVLKISPKFFRPCEVDQLLGDSAKVRSIGWKPDFTFETLIEDMVLNNSSLKN
jgi:GDPmannose 4,6-dehydratase